jgi:uncharacterized membrane protein YfcA
MATVIKWFIGGFIGTLLSAWLCDIIPTWKMELFYFVAIPSIALMAFATFFIVNNVINKSDRDKRK